MAHHNSARTLSQLYTHLHWLHPLPPLHREASLSKRKLAILQASAACKSLCRALDDARDVRPSFFATSFGCLFLSNSSVFLVDGLALTLMEGTWMS